MPSYPSLLVLALAASTVTPVMSVREAEPLKKHEGQASSHLEPVERGLGPLATKISNLNWKIKALIGTGVVVQGFYVYAMTKTYQAKQAALAAKAKANATASASATPSPSSTPLTDATRPTSGDPPTQIYENPSSPHRYEDPLTQQTYEDPSTQQTHEDPSTQQTYEDPSTQQTSTAQMTKPPWVATRRQEERFFDHRSPVDISGEVRDKSHPDVVADGVVTTPGHLEARSLSDIRRTSSQLDLLSRADLGEALSLFSRMLDKLD